MNFSIYKNFSDFISSLIKSPGYAGSIFAVNFLKNGTEVEFLGHKPTSFNKKTNQNTFKIRGFKEIDEFVLYHQFNDLMVIQNVKDVIEKAFFYFMVIEFQDLAFKDEITGYYNQRALKRDVESLISEGTSFQILFMDVDNFKAVNDLHGHITGSSILKVLADEISNNIIGIGDLYRYGGDEFVVILPDMKSVESTKLANTIRTSVEKTKFNANNKKLNFTISIGISEFPTHAKTLNEIITIADHMMYASKKAGKNTVNHAKDLLGN